MPAGCGCGCGLIPPQIDEHWDGDEDGDGGAGGHEAGVGVGSGGRGGEGAMYGERWLCCGGDISGAEARLALAAVDGFLRIMTAGNDLARLDILRAG